MFFWIKLQVSFVKTDESYSNPFFPAVRKVKIIISRSISNISTCPISFVGRHESDMSIF